MQKNVSSKWPKGEGGYGRTRLRLPSAKRPYSCPHKWNGP